MFPNCKGEKENEVVDLISVSCQGSAAPETAPGKVVVEGHGPLSVVKGLDIVTSGEVSDRPVDVS